MFPVRRRNTPSRSPPANRPSAPRSAASVTSGSRALIFQHGGNGYPIPQRGIVSTNGGNHWIIENNIIEWANGTGLDIANGDWNAAPAPHSGDNQIVRGNTIRYCGVEGLAGMGTESALIEDNLIEWCGWANVERAWEAAGAKFHRAHNMLFRRNVIRYIRHGNAVWFDTGAVNDRITSNVFADVVSVASAVHMEMNLQANLIDNNIVWDVRNAEPGTLANAGAPARASSTMPVISSPSHRTLSAAATTLVSSPSSAKIVQEVVQLLAIRSTTTSSRSAASPPSSSSAKRTRPMAISTSAYPIIFKASSAAGKSTSSPSQHGGRSSAGTRTPPRLKWK